MATSFAAIANLSVGNLDVRNDIHLTAIHEAGHCVAGWRAHRAIKRVSVAVTEGQGGSTQWRFQRGATEEGEARVTIAGPVAEAMAVLAADPYPGTTEAEFEEAWEDEITEAVLFSESGDMAILADIYGSQEDAGEFFEIYKTPVREMLAKFWPSLIALAEAIVAHPELTLTGTEAVAVLNAALPAGALPSYPRQLMQAA